MVSNPVWFCCFGLGSFLDCSNLRVITAVHYLSRTMTPKENHLWSGVRLWYCWSCKPEVRYQTCVKKWQGSFKQQLLMVEIHIQFSICSRLAHRSWFSGAGEVCNSWDANSGIKMKKLWSLTSNVISRQFVAATTVISAPVEMHGAHPHNVCGFDLQQLRQGILINIGWDIRTLEPKHIFPAIC